MPLRLKLHSGALTQTVVAHARPSFPHQTIVSRLRPASTQHHSVPSLHFFRLCSSKPPPTSSHDASSNDLSHQVPRSEARSGVRSRGLRRPLIYATAFLLFGVAAGQLVRYMIVPPPLPSPLSLEDAISLRSLHGDADKIAIVQELRSRPDEWSESEAYADPGHIQQNPSLTSIAMGGSRGLGIQRVFWNEKERRVIAVVFFGGALSGWPGVAHGGAIAAILAENMARIAAGNAMDTIAQGSEETINVKYIKPTLANRFYVVRAELDESRTATTDTCESRVRARLETFDTESVCAEATAAYSMPGHSLLSPQSLRLTEV